MPPRKLPAAIERALAAYAVAQLHAGRDMATAHHVAAALAAEGALRAAIAAALPKPPTRVKASPEVESLAVWMYDSWKAVTQGVPNFPRLRKAAERLIAADHLDATIQTAWWQFLRSGDSRFGPEHFVANFGRYTGEALFPPPAKPDTRTEAAKAARFLREGE